MNENRRRKRSRSVVLVFPSPIRRSVERFLEERSGGDREAFAVLLCGRHRQGKRLRLLVRHTVFPNDGCFEHRSAARVQCSQEFDEFVLDRALEEGLTIVSVHTHLHHGQPAFSPVDNRCEAHRAKAIHEVLKRRVFTASVVYDRTARHWQARYWRDGEGSVVPVPMELVTTIGDSLGNRPTRNDPRFDRQVRAFGRDFQDRLSRIQVGMIGVGGLGMQIVESLARMGIRQWFLVDPDNVEVSNLNRLTGATRWDAMDETPKIDVARRIVREIHGEDARVDGRKTALPDRKATRSLSRCDLLVVATDNQSSRLVAQEISSAYLRPLVNAGVSLVAKDGEVSRIFVRVATPPLGGSWCLACGGHLNAHEITKERSDPEHQEMLKARGYLDGPPQPAVHWVNGFAAAQAVSTVHNLISPFQPWEGSGHDVFLDLLDRCMQPIDHPEDGLGCVVCGAGVGGLRGLGDGYLRTESASVVDLDLSLPEPAEEDAVSTLTPDLNPDLGLASAEETGRDASSGELATSGSLVAV